MRLSTCLFIAFAMFSCAKESNENSANTDSSIESVDEKAKSIKVDHTISRDQTHNRFSRSIEPILRVKSGAVIEAFTKEASDEQITPDSELSALDNLDFDPIHPLTGPVYVEEAEPGDILKVTLHTIELGDWGWNAIFPGFGFLADTIDTKYLKIYELGKDKKTVSFQDGIELLLNPFPGVMGVAPDTDSMLTTIPPRANGGNMDDPNMTEGTIMYFPVMVSGGLFSIGDGHAVQGLGEVCGTAIEAPLRIVYEIEVIKGKSIQEPQYETEDYYATTGFGTSIDEAARKATLYMVQYLENEKGLTRDEAYALCSLAGDLHIAEVVDLPHMLVSMHMSKKIFVK